MNLLEELRSLDPRDPGRWPLPVLAGTVALAFLAVALVGIYLLVWNGQRPELQRRLDEEQQLRQQFRDKHAKAVNLDIYKQQIKDIERSFGALPRLVALQNIDVKPGNKDAYDQLSLELTAKTYRYLDEEEVSAAEAEK